MSHCLWGNSAAEVCTDHLIQGGMVRFKEGWLGSKEYLRQYLPSYYCLIVDQNVHTADQ